MICRRRMLATVWLLAVVPLSAPAAPATPDYSAVGLYNLANSYARADKPGLAVLNYERARLLAPGDPDLEANERHVRDSVRLPSEPPSTLQRFVGRLPPTIAAWIGILGLLIGGVALVAGTIPFGGAPPVADATRARAGEARRRSLRSAGLMLGTAAIFLPVCQGVLLWPTLREGVIVTGTAPVLVSPVPMGEPLFSLSEAETVKITAQHEGYVLIRTRTGRSGWVALTNVVPVVPAR